MFLLLLCYHLIILDRSPLPWFDETYFASLALRFQRNGDFYPEIAPLLEFYYPQAKAYGPVYFILIGSMFKIWGFGIFQMRFLSLACAFVFIAIANQILKQSKVKLAYRLGFFLLMVFDTIFLQNAHSGRMDTMALCFASLGILYVMKAKDKPWLMWYFLAGVAYGLALLTTPRIAIVLTGPSLVLAVSFFRNPSWRKVYGSALLVVTCFLLYGIWVYWGFGGPQGAWQYYFGKPKEALYFQSLASGYMNSHFYVPRSQYPALFAGALLVGILFLKKKINLPPLVSCCLTNLFFYYYLVNDTGIYSVFSMPFVYLALVYAMAHLDAVPAVLKLGFFCFLCIFNILIFSLKNSLILSTWKSRDIGEVTRQIGAVVPAGSRVIGDEVYYYSVLEAGSNFQYMDRGADGYRRKRYHENEYRYQYAIVRTPPSDRTQFEHYFQDSGLTPAGTITMQTSDNGLIFNILKALSVEVPKGYNGIIYKR